MRPVGYSYQRWVAAACVSVVFVAFGACHCSGARPGRIHYGGAYLYRFQLVRNDAELDEQCWQRLLATPDMTYVCSQVSAPNPGALVVRRVREAHQAGKRVVLQLWWGGSGPYNWSKYSLAHIAMDPAIRAEFFARVVDPFLSAVGAENVYGAHLLEETGMQFGVDLDVPGVPDDLGDGDDNGSNWDQPTWLGQGAVPGYIGGPYVPNIRRYNGEFRTDTGLDMREAALWSYTGAWRIYRDWVSRRLEAGAMIAFAEHLHARYPGIKAFTWDAVDWGGAGANNMRAMKGRVDGLIMDPYSSAAGIYAHVRAPRLIDPEVEIIAVLWGCDDKPPGEMLNRAVAAYAGGADVLCLFGDQSFQTPEAWTQRVKTFGRFTALPPYEVRSSILLIAGHCTWQNRLAGLSWFDVISGIEADAVPLSDYALVVLYAGATHPGLQTYVSNGGRVLTTHPPRFLLDEGLLVTRKLSTHPQKESVEYQPDAWWREHMGLAESYQLELSRRLAYSPGTPEGKGGHPVLVPYGKGEVCFLQCQTGWNFADAEPLSELRRLLVDLSRGLLRRAGLGELASLAVQGCEGATGCLRIPSRDGTMVSYCLTGKGPCDSRQLEGANLVGADAPALGEDVRGAILRVAQ